MRSADEIRKAAEALREGVEAKNSPYMIPPLWAMAFSDWLDAQVEHECEENREDPDGCPQTAFATDVARLINGGAS